MVFLYFAKLFPDLIFQNGVTLFSGCLRLHDSFNYMFIKVIVIESYFQRSGILNF